MLSTPFICCSSGAATDCSMVTASAPVYVVSTMICGGTMSGNCARGRPPQRDEPTEDGEDRDHHGDNGSVDEEAGHQLSPVGLGAAPNGLGYTGMPGRTFCSPSTTTRSPGCTPSSMIHS